MHYESSNGATSADLCVWWWSSQYSEARSYVLDVRVCTGTQSYWDPRGYRFWRYNGLYMEELSVLVQAKYFRVVLAIFFVTKSAVPFVHMHDPAFNI